MSRLSGKYYCLRYDHEDSPHMIIAKSARSVLHVYSRKLLDVRRTSSYLPLGVEAFRVVKPSESTLDLFKRGYESDARIRFCSEAINSIDSAAESYGVIPEYVHVCHSYNPDPTMAHVDEYDLVGHNSCTNCGPCRFDNLFLKPEENSQVFVDFWADFVEAFSGNLDVDRPEMRPSQAEIESATEPVLLITDNSLTGYSLANSMCEPIRGAAVWGKPLMYCQTIAESDETKAIMDEARDLHKAANPGDEIPPYLRFPLTSKVGLEEKEDDVGIRNVVKNMAITSLPVPIKGQE